MPPAYRGGLFGGAIKGGGWVLLSFLVFEVDALLRGFRRDPPGRLANRRGLFGGQSEEVFWEAFISFGF